MAAVTEPTVTYAEYLEAELRSQEKHEYLRGHVWAMAGGTLEHGRLAMAVGTALSIGLRGRPCVVLSSDVRVRIEETDRSTYPDVTVVCGTRKTASDDRDAVVNPTVIVEVLSDSTEAVDRGEKFAHYRRLADLREYVLVSQKEQRIELFRREADHWSLYEAGPGQWVELASLDVRLVVDEIYFDPLA
jgi:Uma2 family endonuclease